MGHLSSYDIMVPYKSVYQQVLLLFTTTYQH